MIREAILTRMEELDWSYARLVRACEGEVGRSSVYAFLQGKSSLTADSVDVLLRYLRLRIVPDDRPLYGPEPDPRPEIRYKERKALERIAILERIAVMRERRHKK